MIKQPVTLYHEMREELHKRQTEFGEMLPRDIEVARFVRIAAWSIQINQRLAQCSTQSIISALQHAAKDGLLPDGRESALVPYQGENGEMICQYMPMIAGIRKKVYNSKELKTWQVQVVQEGDEFDYQLGDNPFIHHKPAERGGRSRPVIAAYSIATFPDGSKTYEVMNRDQITDIRSKSRARRGPWSDPIYAPEMARKTVAKLHAKQLPMDDDMIGLWPRDDAQFGPDDIRGGQRQHRVAPPRTTRAALAQYAPGNASAIEMEEEGFAPPPSEPPKRKPGRPPKHATPPESLSDELIENVDTVVRVAEQTMADQPGMPRSADEYWKRYIQWRDSVNKDAHGAEALKQWFNSAEERKLRSLCNIDLVEMDELERDLNRHVTKITRQE